MKKGERDAVNQLAEALVRLGTNKKVDVEALRKVIDYQTTEIEEREAAYSAILGQAVACRIIRSWTEPCGGAGGVIYFAGSLGVRRAPIAWGGSQCTPCFGGVRYCVEYECRVTTIA